MTDAHAAGNPSPLAQAARIAELEAQLVGQRRAIEALLQESEVLSGIIATQDLAIERLKKRETANANPR